MTLRLDGGHTHLDYSLDGPCPTIMASGIGNVGPHQYEIIDDEKARKNMGDKPLYEVPTIKEIEEIPWNGFNAVSTFSGAGGSCLGFRMAGFRVLWASEFVPAAAEVYQLNHDAYLDTRDIREVTPEDILKKIGMERGELDLMDGSPPCASFSTAGKRHDSWGEVRKYSDVKQRVDDLFFEFARIIEGVQPKVFVAENVSGLVTGVAKGYFKMILAELKNCGYDVQAKLLDAQWLGVPQMRRRLFFIGVRSDLGLSPKFPAPMSYRYSMYDALPWLAEAKIVYDNKGTRGFGKRFEYQDDVAPTITANSGSTGHHFVYIDEDTDTNVSIDGMPVGERWKNLEIGGHDQERFNLWRLDPDKPSMTVTQVGGNVGAAGITHPYEPRKFTIKELKRICGFPDDFVLTGTYTKQWERLGRAVPPVMMEKIASVIRDEVLKKIA